MDFANSDSSMIFIFLKFLREVCGVNEDKLRIYLYCYSNQNIDKIRRYWSRLLKVPIKQFSKPYVRKDFRLDKAGKMPYGLVHIRYYDKKLLHLIRGWIEELKKDMSWDTQVVNEGGL